MDQRIVLPFRQKNCDYRRITFLVGMYAPPCLNPCR